MRISRIGVVAVIVHVGLSGSAVTAAAPRPGLATATAQRTALEALREQHPRAVVNRDRDRITRIFGSTFGFGGGPIETAESFRRDYAGVFGVTPAALVLRPLTVEGRQVQPVLWDPAAQTYRFTLVQYEQQHDGVPVFRGRLKLLVRNEPGFPLVSAASALRPLGRFAIVAARREELRKEQFLKDALDRGLAAVVVALPSLANFTQPEVVIWAGADEERPEPRLAVTFFGDNFGPGLAQDARWLFVTDAATGAILHQENQIVDVDVSGNVSAMASEPPDADFCESEVVTPMPYARVTIGGTTAFANVNGDYTISNAGEEVVAVESEVRGRWFQVFNAAAPAAMLTTMTSPPGPADFMHNAGNSSEFERGEVNGYIQANVVRDFALVQNPAYPTLDDQEFPVVVNRNDVLCPGNAWFDGSSINFCRSGGGRPNTAFADVVHHEYGHNLVQAGGSGQGAYGEGMSDCMAVLISDNPLLGVGFFGSCGGALRNADNAMQYPCSGGSHFCGQLLSGCVWSTRDELQATHPSTYLDILSSLTVNSILLHNISGVAPDIAADFLTLDDDDADVRNGTPNCVEIYAGFGAHNMHPPGISPVTFDYPLGLPESFEPQTPTVIRVETGAICATPTPGSGQLHFRFGTSGPFAVVAMDVVSTDVYDATLPAAPCPTEIQYFFSVDSSDNQTVTDPIDGPTNPYGGFAAASFETIVHYDFESTPGWTVENVGVSDGSWDPQPQVPVLGCDRGAPAFDFDGSGRCWLTENDPNNCNSDVDQGQTRLVSEVFDLTPLTDPYVSYARWYSNTGFGFSETQPFDIEVSGDGGTSWSTLEIVGPTTTSPNPEVEGGWFVKTFRIADFVPITDGFRIRFTAQDEGLPVAGDTVEAGIDAFRIFEFLCVAPCPAANGDLNDDQQVDGVDLALFVAGVFGAPSQEERCAGDFDGSNALDSGDVAGMVQALLGS